MEHNNLNDMVQQAAANHPHKTFLYWTDKNRSLTYSEGIELAGKVAGALAELGVEKGDRIGIFAHNGLDHKLAMLGAWKLGAVSCAINVSQASNLANYVHDCTPKVLIYTHDMLPAIRQNRDKMSSIKHYLCMDGPQEGAKDWNLLLKAAQPTGEREIRSQDLAVIVYADREHDISGRQPLSHGQVLEAVRDFSEKYSLTQSEITLGLTSPTGLMELKVNFLVGINQESTIGMMSKWQATTAWQEMEEREVSYCTGDLQVCEALLELCRRRNKPRALRTIFSHEDPQFSEVQKAFLEEFGITVHLVQQ